MALKSPTDLAAAADGTLYVLDGGSVLRIAPDGTTTTLLSGLQDGDTTTTPAHLALRPNGKLVVGGADPHGFSVQPSQTLFEVDPAHPDAPTRLGKGTQMGTTTFAVGPDGAVYLAELTATYGGVVGKLGADGQIAPIIDAAAKAFAIQALSFDEHGHLLVTTIGGADAKAWSWSTADGLQVRDPAAFWPVVFDAAGRGYGDGSQLPSPGGTTIDRFDAVAAKGLPLIGPGGKLFAGTGVDDGVDKPRRPCFDGAGNLYFLDTGHKQIKRVAASAL